MADTARARWPVRTPPPASHHPTRSIIKSFMYGSFDQSYQATIGIDFLSKTMYLDDRTVRLQIWDSAGQECVRAEVARARRGS